MKIAIVGSRKFPELQLVEDYVKTHCTIEDTILSGGAIGVDATAIAIAKELGIPTQEFLPDMEGITERYQYTKAYYKRNQQIVDACDKVVAFSEKDNGGTWITVRYAKKAGKPIELIRPSSYVLNAKKKPAYDRSRKPENAGAGPFHMKSVGCGSMALKARKYLSSLEWAEFLNQKQDTPVECGLRMLPDFEKFLHDYPYGAIHAITQAPKSIRHKGQAHPMDTVCQRLSETQGIPYVTLFQAWNKPHRGLCLGDTPPLLTPLASLYAGKIVLVLDDIATTKTTMRLSVKALIQAGIHAHGIVWMYF